MPNALSLTGSFLALGQSKIDAIGMIVEITAQAIRDGAADRSRVDTGAMQAGWTMQMTGPTSAEVSNPVDYTIYNEYGTAHMTAQPMLHPAVDAVRPEFEAILRQVVH